MRILLLDDYSGLFKNLRSGLIKNGHSVTFIGTGDGWKNIGGMDVAINSGGKSIYGKILRRLQVLWWLPQMKGYDAVLLINQSFLFQGISRLMIWFLSRNNKTIFLSACGGDVPYADFGTRGGFKDNHWPHAGIKNDTQLKKYQRSFHRKLHKRLCKKLNGVIPIAYEYAEAWRRCGEKELLIPTIPPSIDVSAIEPRYIKNTKKKLVFFHGINREDYKGTSLITEAMTNMAERYPNDIEIIIDGKMPLDDYLELMARADVVIDQCKAYSYSSMNALYAMALGKLVMVHCEDEAIDEFGIKETPPVFKISADVSVIEGQIKRIIEMRGELKNISVQSRKYVEKFHNSTLIAQIYVDHIEAAIASSH